MTELRQSLESFNRRKKQAEVTAALAFDFNPTLEDSLPKPETEMKNAKNKEPKNVNFG